VSKPADEFVSPIKPPESSDEASLPTLAPAWVALASAWIGLIVLIASIVLLFLPGSQDPRAELEHLTRYSLADRFILVPMWGIAIGLFCGFIVMWQMRRHPRPLNDAMVMQRVQAWIGIALALIATVIIYIHVALHGPRST
jgi:hypothetical protein